MKNAIWREGLALWTDSGDGSISRLNGRPLNDAHVAVLFLALFHYLLWFHGRQRVLWSPLVLTWGATTGDP